MERLVFSGKGDVRDFVREHDLDDEMTVDEAAEVIREAQDWGICGEPVDFDAVLAMGGVL
jgi:hypothetical protein